MKETLPTLNFLALCNATEIMDAKSSLQNMDGLAVCYFTQNKAYHGEWWSHITALQTKCACNVPLGVAGVYPETLERLFLTTECPEPVSVSTAQIAHQPKAYPHKVGARDLCIATIHNARQLTFDRNRKVRGRCLTDCSCACVTWELSDV